MPLSPASIYLTSIISVQYHKFHRFECFDLSAKNRKHSTDFRGGGERPETTRHRKWMKQMQKPSSDRASGRNRRPQNLFYLDGILWYNQSSMLQARKKTGQEEIIRKQMTHF